MTRFDDLIDQFYEATVRPDLLRQAVSTTHDLFRSTAGGLYVQTLHQSEGRMAGADAAIAIGFDVKREEAYWDYYYSRNPMFELTKRLGTGRPTTDADTILLPSTPRFDEGEFFEDWARPQGFRHVMGEFLERRNDGVLIMALWRQAGEGGFDADEVAAFGRLNRHVARAFDVGERLRVAEAEMEAVLNRSAAAVVTVGRDGAMRRCNAAADALLAAGTALRRSERRLRTAVADDQPSLDRLVACALEPRLAAWTENAAVPIRRTDGRPPLVARAVAVAERFSPFAPDRTASVILTFEGGDAEHDRSADRLRRRFGLTPAQTRLALALRAGRSLAVAAEEIGIGIETARSHLKAVFARTGTHRQAELVLFLDAELDR